MNRDKDLRWFESNRPRLAERYKGRWLVVLHEAVIQDFEHEEDAVEAAVTRFGINVACVFHAVETDPVEFIGL